MHQENLEYNRRIYRDFYSNLKSITGNHNHLLQWQQRRAGSPQPFSKAFSLFLATAYSEYTGPILLCSEIHAEEIWTIHIFYRTESLRPLRGWECLFLPHYSEMPKLNPLHWLYRVYRHLNYFMGDISMDIHLQQKIKKR